MSNYILFIIVVMALNYSAFKDNGKLDIKTMSVKEKRLFFITVIIWIIAAIIPMTLVGYGIIKKCFMEGYYLALTLLSVMVWLCTTIIYIAVLYKLTEKKNIEKDQYMSFDVVVI